MVTQEILDTFVFSTIGGEKLLDITQQDKKLRMLLRSILKKKG